MQAHALTLSPGVSITLLNEGSGWRFGSWSRNAHPIYEMPDTMDLERTFDSVENARDFFRSRYDHMISRPRT